jgi:hypothetical protein
MKDLIIGTVLKDGSPTQRKWLDTQLAFIRATTDEFDHVAVVNKRVPPNSMPTTVIHPVKQGLEGSKGHQQALMILADWFQRHQHEYRHFMFLDCDAFPIRKHWLDILDAKMGSKELAAIIRPENMEFRLHASIMVVKPQSLPNINFVATKVGHRLDGSIEKDLNVPYYEGRRDLTLGMVRSNKHNIHPVGCGIYFDMFYHHTNGGDCQHIEGSRFYWDHMIPPTQNLFRYRDELFENPTLFVRRLGWNPTSYVTIPQDVCPSTASQT